MALSQDVAEEAVNEIASGGIAELKVNTPRRRKLLTKLLQMTEGETFSEDVFQGLEFYVENRAELEEQLDNSLEEKAQETIHSYYNGG